MHNYSKQNKKNCILLLNTVHTSGEVIWFDKLLEKLVSSRHFVQVICVLRKPKFENPTFLQWEIIFFNITSIKLKSNNNVQVDLQ